MADTAAVDASVYVQRLGFSTAEVVDSRIIGRLSNGARRWSGGREYHDWACPSLRLDIYDEGGQIYGQAEVVGLPIVGEPTCTKTKVVSNNCFAI